MKNYITIDDENIAIEIDGEKKFFDILLSFDCVENGRTYIGFTDNTLDEDGDVIIYYASYDPNAQNGLLYDVVYDEEKRMLDDILKNVELSME